MAQQDNIVLRFEFPHARDTGEIRTLNIYRDQGAGSRALHLYKVCHCASGEASYLPMTDGASSKVPSRLDGASNYDNYIRAYEYKYANLGNSRKYRVAWAE